METKPQISVIVPVYKVEPYLQKCIDSILAQTFRDIEVILVDDGSPDNCPAICDAAAEKDERVRVIHQKNGGLSAARNAGLDIARGEWIGFVDSDDYIAPEMYRTLYQLAQEHHADLAICGVQLIDEQDKPLKEPPSAPKLFVLDQEQAIARIYTQPFHLAYNKMYKKEIFKTLRYPIGRLNEDSFVIPSVLEQITTAVYTQQQLYGYRQRTGSIMHSPKTLRNWDGAEAAYLCWQCMLRHGQKGGALVGGAMFVLGSTRETYCGLSREDRRTPRSREMKKKQWNVTCQTLKCGGFSTKLLVQSLFFQLWPMGYQATHEWKAGC